VAEVAGAPAVSGFGERRSMTAAMAAPAMPTSTTAATAMTTPCERFGAPPEPLHAAPVAPPYA
jgi:hypothetical protein